MDSVGFFSAFVAGFLSLLPACGPLILPAYFANLFSSPNRIVLHTLVFAFGFLVIFLPFGLGVRQVVEIVSQDTPSIHDWLGFVLTIWGVFCLVGFRLPLFSLQIGRKLEPESLTRSFLLGFGFGLTSGACSAPIFGAITTLAVAQDSYLLAGALLLVFASGLFLPLVTISLLIKKFGSKKLAHLFSSGIEFVFFGRVIKIYWGNVFSGVLFIILGVALFLDLSLFPWGLKKELLRWFYEINLKLLG